MIDREAQRLLITVPMVMANARDLLEAGWRQHAALDGVEQRVAPDLWPHPANG